MTASRAPRPQKDCPVRRAGKPVLGAVLATMALVTASLVIQNNTDVTPGGPDAYLHAPSPPATPTPTSLGALERPGEAVTVVRVVDGDTAKVKTASGQERTLRFIGLDTPETVHPSKPVQCYGPEASAEAKRVLPVGATVRIEYDSTQGRTDRYQRHLVYLTLPGPFDFAEHMITHGYGTEYLYSKKYDRRATYVSAEATAEEAGRGLWGACAN